jgi:hypothetical protein
LGGEIPYGSGAQRLVLTKAQSKEYPPTPACSTNETTSEGIIIREPAKILPDSNLINLTQKNKTVEESSETVAVVRCSVIQRVPSTTPSNSSSPALPGSSNPFSPSPNTIQQHQLPPRKNERLLTATTAQPPSSQHHARLMHSACRKMTIYRPLHHTMALPEQEHPIDYHIPKKRDMGASVKRSNSSEEGDKIGNEEEEDKKIKRFEAMEERDRRIREAKRQILHRALLQHIRRLPPGSPMIRRLAGIVHAAAGHGRSSSSNNGAQTNGSSGTSSSNGSSGTSINFSSSSCGSAGAAGGASGAGGNGRDNNRSNYGPNSPPTGSLPPFYESLKGGSNGGGLNAYNAQNNLNGNAFNNYLLNTTLTQMECDANGELTNINGYPSSPQDASTKQYSVLQNAYLQNGMILKDEIDLDYDGKIDTLSLNGNLLQNYGDAYSDSMMVDLSSAVDPLQLTATLTFSSPNEHALLESLTDAVDLSQFLQRLPTDDDQCNELELSSTSSLTPDSNGDHHHHHHHHQTHHNGGMDSFQDQLIGGGRGGSNGNNNNTNGFQSDRQLFYKSSPPSSASSNYENPPPYQTSTTTTSTRCGENNNGNMRNSLLQYHVPNGFDMDSHSSNLSLPSPSTSHYDSIHSPPQQAHHTNGNLSGNEALQSATPSPPGAMATIQNVSKSRNGGRRISTSASSKLSTLLSATLPDPPIITDSKNVLQQRVSKMQLIFKFDKRYFSSSSVFSISFPLSLTLARAFSFLTHN